jgi:hypothetical protein
LKFWREFTPPLKTAGLLFQSVAPDRQLLSNIRMIEAHARGLASNFENLLYSLEQFPEKLQKPEIGSLRLRRQILGEE